MDRITYDIENYLFRDIVSQWFFNRGILPYFGLPSLHSERDYELFDREHDQSTIWHKCFYEMIREDKSFDDSYTDFLHDIIKPRFGEEIVYQKIPTFRVHLPNNVSVGEFHKDKHYRDENWAEKVEELNLTTLRL